MLNISLTDLFLIITDANIASYADDDTIYQPGSNVDDVVNGLQVSAEKSFGWFTDYQMKENTDICHLIMGTNNAQEIQVGESLIKTCNCEKLLCI